MSKIDETFINALGTFTDALAEIVEALKGQQDKGKTDVVNDFLKTPMNDLLGIVNDIKKSNEVSIAKNEKMFADIKNQNDAILKKIESVKNEKESGTFDKIEDPRNKNKIVDGIKVIMLIAGGVLAMGMAFKIIGNVDFLSVLALSGAILVMSVVFSKISDLKGLKYADIFKISLILPIMAASLIVSGLLLSAFPTFTIGQGISMIFVSGALGIATFLLLKSISKLKPVQLLMAPLLPIILPLIALGLVLSSYILKGIQFLSIKQVLAIALVGLAIGIATFAIGLALKGLKGITWKELLAIPIMIPLIAGGIVLASWIFQGFIPIQNPLQLLIGSAVIGLSLLIFSIPIKILGKMKLADLALGILAVVPLSMAIAKSSRVFQDFIPLKNPLQVVLSSLAMGISILLFSPAVYILGQMKLKDVATGVLAIPFIAGAIVASAYIFNELPGDMRYPDFIWSLGTGLALLVFMPVVYFASKLDSKKLLQSAFAIPVIAGAILASALIFSLLPNKMKYPEYEWSLGVGLAFLIFVPVAYLASTMEFWQDTDIKKRLVNAGIAMVGLAGIIFLTAWIFQALPSDMKYPDLMWTLGAGASILGFGLLAIGLGAEVFGPQALAFAAGLLAILALSATMVGVAAILSTGDYSNFPSIDWAIVVGGSLLAFSLAMVAATVGGIVGLIGKLFTGGKDPLVKMAQSMVDVANTLNQVDWKSAQYPSLSYAQGVGGLLFTFAGIFAAISMVEGFNKIVTALFGGGKSDSFTVFIANATTAMVESHKVISKENWSSKNFPSKEYAEGVGGLLLTFANIFASISKVEGFNSIVAKLFKGSQPDSFITFVNNATNAMIESHKVISKEDWSSKSFPSKDYAEGVGGLLEALANSFASISRTQGFSGIMAKLGLGGTNFIDFVKSAAESMITLRNILSGSGNWDTASFPKKEYAESFGSLLISMADAYSKLGGGGLFASISKLLGGGKQSLSEFVIEASTSIVKASQILVDGKFTTIPDKKWIDNFNDVIIKYAKIANKIDDADLLESNKIILGLIQSMISNATEFNKIDWNSASMPNKDYINNFSYLMLELNKITSRIDDDILESNELILGIARNMVNVALEFNSIKWDVSSIPSKDYITNFSYLMLEMYKITNRINNNILKSNQLILGVVGNMVNIALEFNKVKWDSVSIPSNKYVTDFSFFIEVMSKNSEKIDTLKSNNLLLNFAENTVKVAEAFNKIDWDSVSIPTNKYITNFSFLVSVMSNIVEKINTLKSNNILNFAENTVKIAEAFNKINWNTISFPTNEYINNFSYLMLEMSKIIDKVSIIGSADLLSRFAENVVKIASDFNTVNWDSVTFPTKDYIDNFSYLISEISKIVINVPGDFIDISLNVSAAITKSSHILSAGKYDNFPTRPNVEMFAFFMLSMSDVVEKSNLDTSKSAKFLNSTDIILPAINKWIQLISKGNFKQTPSKSYTDNFDYYLLGLDKVISNWQTTVKEADIFKKSIKSIVEAFDDITSMPNLSNSVVDNMKIVKESLIELVEGVDAFMYEKSGGAKGFWNTVSGNKTKRSMEDFMLFATGLGTIISAVGMLSLLKPIPGGVTNGFAEFINQLKELPDITGLDTKAESINKLAMSFSTLADSLASVNSNLEGFATLYKGINTLTSLDTNVKMTEGTLKIINDAQSGQANVLNKAKGESENEEETKKYNIEDSKILEDRTAELKQQKQFYSDISDIKNLLYDLKENLDKPSRAESFKQ